MGKLASIFKDTAIYGLSSIIGRFLNYLLVPLYTAQLTAASGGYGIITNIYAYVALVLVLLTFGMETTYFRFTNKTHTDSETVYGTTLISVGTVSLAFAVVVLLLLNPISGLMGYGEHPEYVGVMAVTVAIDAFLCIPFAHLRQQKKAMKFAALKLLNIVVSIALNLVYFYFMDGKDVAYAFYINLVCTVMLAVCLITEYTGFRWKLDTKLLRTMLSYSWPILVLGIAGILNQAADKMLFPYLYKGADMQAQLGIYGACSKIAMIMAMITQAFRFAYEPIVFAGVKDKDQHEMYAQAMKYFIIFTLLAFLMVVGYLDVLKYIIGTIAKIDSPMTPSMEGSYNYMGYENGYTDEMVQKSRDEILSCNQETIRELAKFVRLLSDSDAICAVGNEYKLSEAEGLFKTIESI